MPSGKKNSRVLAWLERPASFHRVIQYAFLIFFTFVGIRFYLFVQWAMGQSTLYVDKPASVEAFLPISSLLGARRLFATGEYDFIHPAGLTILFMALAAALVFRKAFCGYLCPVGGLSMLLERMGKKLGIHRQLPQWLSVLLTIPKYLLLLSFIHLLFWNMNIRDIEAFIRTPYNMVADSKMLLFFLNPSLILIVILGVLVVGSMLFSSFWCRGFCPYGALLGLFSMFSPFAVQRDKDKCTDCRRCTNVCPSRIAVHTKKRVTGPECVGCMECVSVCPQKECLDLRLGYTRQARRISYWWLGLGALAVVYCFFSWAAMSDNWKSHIPPNEIRMYHRNIFQMSHP
jgi:Polyferredoxin